MTHTRLTILMPAYNEAATIEEILRRVDGAEAAGLEKELIVVDDCSTDGTREALGRLKGLTNPIRVLLHDRNRGKGAAIRTGLAEARGDIVLIQDSDLEYDPRDYPALLEPILSGRADVVYGNRFHGGSRRVLYFWHTLGNLLLTTISNLLINMNFHDMEVGYKVFRRSFLERVRLESDRFGFEPEITVKMVRLGARVYEVPISYHGRTYEEGKKITWKDAVVTLYCLFRYRFLG
jgi:glycosyltransferase involved in cell wall biosynthesis